MASKVFVTGDSGFVGQALVKHLLKAGYDVVGASRTISKSLEDFSLTTQGKYSHLKIDITLLSNSSEIRELAAAELKGCFAVIHLASRVHEVKEKSLDPKGEYHKVNVESSEALAKVSVAAGVQRFIFLSSIKASGANSEPGKPFKNAVLSSPEEAYGISKLEAEKRLLEIARSEKSFKVICLRPPLVYGPLVKANFKSLVSLVRKLPVLPFGSLSNRRTFIYVENLVSAVKLLLEFSNLESGSFLVSDNETISTKELTSIIGKNQRKTVKFLPIPAFVFRKAGFANLVDNLEVDNTEFKQKFRWEPPFTIGEGLQQTISGMLEHERSKLRVLVISQYFWPENFRINDLVSTLLQQGHQVDVLTGIPNYPEGKFFPGYNWLSRNPEPLPRHLEGAGLHRLWIISRGNKRGFRLVFNYFSFVFLGTIYATFFLRKRYDCSFVFAVSPLLQAIPGVALKKFHKVPMIVWIQDLWPETLSAVGAVKSNGIIRAVGSVVRWIYKNSDLLLVQSKAFTEKVQHWGGSAEQIRYLPNWADEVDSASISKSVDELPVGFRILFAGNLGKAQGLDAVIDAAKLTRGDQELKWIFVGDGSERSNLEKRVKELGLESTVKFLGRKPSEAMPIYFAKAQALLVTLSADPVFELVVPSKVQAYLTAGKPLLGALNGEGARLINEEKVGIAGAALDSNTLAANVRALRAKSLQEIDEIGLRAKALYYREFRKEQLTSELVNWIRDLRR